MKRPLLLALSLLLATLILSLAIGSVFIPPAELWNILRGVGEEAFRRGVALRRHIREAVAA